MQLRIETLYQKFLSNRVKEKTEGFILWIAILSFIIHMLIIGLKHFKLIEIDDPSGLLNNPIAAIYTPFSFILVYEVYLLIYYLPKSTALYVSKQYEIITLIVFRRLFKDLANLNLTANWFENKYDLQFTFDLVTSVALFYLIYLLHLQRSKIYKTDDVSPLVRERVSKFINTKKWIATALVPSLFLISIFSFLNWALSVFHIGSASPIPFKNINNIFFEQFFTVLIFVDVFLLLFSFFHTDDFHKVIRNSGFIISTILLRISFAVEGLTNNLLIVTAVLFGLLMIVIHNRFEKKLDLNEIDKAEG